MLQGIRYRRTSFYGFMIGSGLAAVSGGLMAPLTPITPALGERLSDEGFYYHHYRRAGKYSRRNLGGFLIAAIESVAGYFFDLSTRPSRCSPW